MTPSRLPRSSRPASTALFTLVFRNGQRLLHQDPLAVAQFRSDGRLVAVWREPAGQVLPSSPDRG